MILSTSRANSEKSSNLCSWFICQLLESMPERFEIYNPGNCFVDFCSEIQKVLKSMLPAIVLLTSVAKGSKYQRRRFRLPVIFPKMYIPFQKVRLQNLACFCAHTPLVPMGSLCMRSPTRIFGKACVLLRTVCFF